MSPMIRTGCCLSANMILRSSCVACRVGCWHSDELQKHTRCVTTTTTSNSRPAESQYRCTHALPVSSDTPPPFLCWAPGLARLYTLLPFDTTAQGQAASFIARCYQPQSRACDRSSVNLECCWIGARLWPSIPLTPSIPVNPKEHASK